MERCSRSSINCKLKPTTNKAQIWKRNGTTVAWIKPCWSWMLWCSGARRCNPCRWVGHGASVLVSGLIKLGPSPDPVGSPFSLLCQDLRRHGALLRNRSDVAAWTRIRTMNPNRPLFLITYPAFCYGNRKQSKTNIQGWCGHGTTESLNHCWWKQKMA